jgi:hypothetical protein
MRLEVQNSSRFFLGDLSFSFVSLCFLGKASWESILICYIFLFSLLIISPPLGKTFFHVGKKKHPMRMPPFSSRARVYI